MDHQSRNQDIDLTVICNVKNSDGIGRQGFGIINALHDQFRINSLQLPPSDYKDVPKEALKILIKPFDGFGKVAFWTYILGLNAQTIQIHQGISSAIKI